MLAFLLSVAHAADTVHIRDLPLEPLPTRVDFDGVRLEVDGVRVRGPAGQKYRYVRSVLEHQPECHEALARFDEAERKSRLLAFASTLVPFVGPRPLISVSLQTSLGVAAAHEGDLAHREQERAMLAYTLARDLEAFPEDAP